MKAGYFKTVWNDIKNTPGWFVKILLLSLISLIPIFGQIVVGGYLLGWARDSAWGVYAPMPARIFGNGDGKLYSRGFFALVIEIVFSLIPFLLVLVLMFILSAGALPLMGGQNVGVFAFFAVLVSMVFMVAIVATAFFVIFFQWVGSLRMSIYGRLSAGLQMMQIWKMIKRDFGGLLRIFAMVLIVGFIGGFVVSFFYSIVFTLGFAGLGVSAFSIFPGGGASATPEMATLTIGVVIAVIVIILASIVFGFASMLLSTFILALSYRALGYWTCQFDVPAWHGQDNPLPFEREYRP